VHDPDTPAVEARALSLAHDGVVIQQGLDFQVRSGEVFVIVGESGCGKSTLLRHLVGLQVPRAGQVLIGGVDLHAAAGEEAPALRRRFGVMFQAGALWSAMTVGDNLLLPLRLFAPGPEPLLEQQARLKLALVGLDGAFDLMPAQLSGGMRKRAALARALALDPALLFLDEPGSGLDPVNARRLDELVLQLRDHLGTTVVMVTHEIASVFAVADRVLFLDGPARTMTALGTPRALLHEGPSAVRDFMRPPMERAA
jgi:phospholipid/cholesterol/gamma-HCH transport system ATP-binding protein